MFEVESSLNSASGARMSPSLSIRSLIATGFVLALWIFPQGAQGQIATDRPDFVESSLTVPHRAWQLETSLGWVDDEAVNVFATPTLVRWGFLPNLEARLETGLLNWSRPEGSSPGAEADDDFGLADVALGVKWHAADNRGLVPSTALLLHVALPTGTGAFRGDGARPSLRAVGEWSLPHGIGIGSMVGAVYESGSEERFWAGIFGAVVGVAVAERGRAFAEIALPLMAGDEHGGNLGLWDFGFSWLLRNDMQVDAAFSLPATDAAPDLVFGVGFSKLWAP
jgi:hypothetical protein